MSKGRLFKEATIVIDDSLDAKNNELKTFTAEERKELAAYEAIIHSGSVQDSLALSERIKDADPLVLFKFSQESSYFKRFCESSSFNHLSAWVDELANAGKNEGEPQEGEGERNGYLAVELYSFESGKKVAIFDHYVAAYFYEKYLELQETEPNGIEASFYLAKACELNFFDALLARCEKNLLKIQKNDVGEKEETIAIGYILQDLAALGQYYWSVGYFHASRILLEVGNYYGGLAEEGSGAKKAGYHIEALRNFFRGAILLDQKLPENQHLIDTLYPAKGLGVFGFDDIKKARASVMEQIDTTLVPVGELFIEAEKAVAGWIKAVARKDKA